MYWRRSKVQEEGTANDNLINESTFSIWLHGKQESYTKGKMFKDFRKTSLINAYL